MTAPSVPDSVLALALAVSDTHQPAMYLLADHTSDGSDTVPRASQSGRPYMVVVRPDVLAFDQDEPALAWTVDAVAARVTGAGLAPVIVRSGGENRHHVWCWAPDPRQRLELVTVARELKLDHRHGGRRIRPPLSPHRHGYAVGLVDPTTPELALEALRWRDRQVNPASFDQAGVLPDRWTARLLSGDTTGYHSRSELQMALLVQMCNVGWPFDKCHVAFLGCPQGAGKRLHERIGTRGEAAARQELAADYAKAHAKVAASPPIQGLYDVRQRVELMAGYADTQRWSGKTGHTDRAVLAAFHHIAWTSGRVEISASWRQLATLTSTAKETVGRSLGRLQRRPWLTLKQTGRGEQASLYRLALDPGNEPLSTSLGGVRTNGAFPVPKHHVFATYGIGLVGWRLWHALQAPLPVTLAELREGLGFSVSSLQTRLKQMASYGLVGCEDGWYWLLPEAEDVMQTLVLPGSQELVSLRHRRYELDQRAYRGGPSAAA